jgi:hypothetical protein
MTTNTLDFMEDPREWEIEYRKNYKNRKQKVHVTKNGKGKIAKLIEKKKEVK